MIKTQSIRKIPASALRLAFWTLLGEVVAPLVVGAVVWRFGAGYTVAALRWLASAFGYSTEGVGWYIVPAIFSAIEIAFWQLRSKMSPTVRRLAIGMGVADVLTTLAGIFLAITTDYLPRLGVATLTNTHIAVAIATAAVAAWWVTFSPEKYILNAVFQLIELVKFGKACLNPPQAKGS